MDNTRSNRPERRTAIIARELNKFNVDIAALSETRRSGEGQLKEQAGGYTFYWKGKGDNEPRIHGVGFAIRNNLVGSLVNVPIGINERLMHLELQLSKHQSANIISAYAPTLIADNKVKEQFYSQLDDLLTHIPKDNKLILLGDFNARVGRDQIWKEVIGCHGIGKCNTNGTLLLTKCAEHDLVITNTQFRQKNKFKTTWQHPRSKHWHLIDYVIVRARDLNDVCITKTITSADDCWTDHRLVRSTMALHSSSTFNKCRKKIRPKKINVNGFKDAQKVVKFQQILGERLPSSFPTDIEQHWSSLKSIIMSACVESVGYQLKKHQDWFDENDIEIEQLIDVKRKALNSWRSDPSCLNKKNIFTAAKAEVQRKTRILKNNWWINKSIEIQNLADTNNSRAFFGATKAIYGPSCHGVHPIKTKDGRALLKDNESISVRWKEHFEQLLNQNTTVDETAFQEIPQFPTRDELGLIPTIGEITSAIKSLKCNKAAGLDGIPAEAFKHGGNGMVLQLQQLINKIWLEESIPGDLKNAAIVTVFKKGDKSDCDNYRGISLLSIAGKIITRILSNRLTDVSESFLPESQSGFRPSRGTIDMIFTARQLQEKCREQNRPLYMAFIDLVKAFDSVNRDALWKLLSLIGCPDKFVNILRLFHDNMKAMVIANGVPGESFEVRTGVKQGCVIAPSLFSIFIASIIHLVKNDIPQCTNLVYRIDGKLFNLGRFRSKSKTTITSIVELQYADDNAIVAESEADLQAILNTFNRVYKSIGLKINTAKTQILYQPSPTTTSLIQPNIQLDGVTLQNVDHFPYLGSHLSSNAVIDDEIQHRIKCASTSFGRLRKRVFQNKDLRADTKCLVYKAVVMPTLLYGCETWTTHKRHLRCLEQYHQRCLRKILGIKWQDKRTNVSILKQTGLTSVECLIIRHQLRWTGHVVRMPDSRLPKQLLYAQLAEGRRHLGAPKKRYKDALKANIKKCHIDVANWELIAEDRSRWRRTISHGVKTFENSRIIEELKRREIRKGRKNVASNSPRAVSPRNICPHCGKVCKSKIGLFSHLRIH